MFNIHPHVLTFIESQAVSLKPLKVEVAIRYIWWLGKSEFPTSVGYITVISYIHIQHFYPVRRWMVHVATAHNFFRLKEFYFVF